MYSQANRFYKNHSHGRNNNRPGFPNSAEFLPVLNRDDTTFVQLYSCIPRIQNGNHFRYLNTRNQIAVRFCLSKDYKTVDVQEQEVLRWMITSSYDKEPDSDAFQQVIDRAVIKLLVVYNDVSILNCVVALMFSRYREDQCIYDLCWAFYQSHTRETLPLVAYYLQSDNPRDNHLAYKLLNFKPELQPDNKKQQYANYLTWYNENKDFLYFNEENLQETSKPKYWRVDHQSKYLCKQKDEQLSALERQHLVDFCKLERTEQKKLSKTSYSLSKSDKQNWSKWFASPVSAQLKNSGRVGRGKND